MKKLLLFASSMLLITVYATAQVGYFNVRLNYVDGQGVQKGKIDAGGIGLQFEGFKSKTAKIGFVFTAESNYTGMETRKADLSFSGSNATTDVNYYSSLNKVTGGLIFSPVQGAFVSPYISLQAGMAWYRTKLVIEDPDDPSACSPVQTKNVKFSVSGIGNVESGFKVKVRKNSKTPMYLQASV